jgi:hypothetical protein
LSAKGFKNALSCPSVPENFPDFLEFILIFLELFLFIRKL